MGKNSRGSGKDGQDAPAPEERIARLYVKILRMFGLVVLTIAVIYAACVIAAHFGVIPVYVPDSVETPSLS